MNNHPQIAELYKIYKSESQLFRKVHRMIDLFESIIKSHTVLIMTEYVKYNKLSDAAKGLLAQGLRTPSLGTWQLFSRVLFEELEKDNYPWLLPDFAGEFVTLDKALNVEKTNVIAFRNGYAHGATPIDAQCEADIKKFEPFLTQLLESKWLNTSSLEVRDNKVYLVCKAGELTLHPMLLYRKEDAESSFAFFNDLKNDKIGLLNYPLSKHYREKDFFAEFHEHLPLNDWKKTGNNEFYQRIEELTETFKGRTIEREKLLQFVLHNHKGYFSIQGNPGIGKSALIAQFFKDLRTHAEVKKLKVIEYFIRRGTQQAQVEYMFNYLIRRTDEVFPAGKEIRAEGKMVFDLQSQLFAKWRLWGEQANGQQLLFLIDGLDEGVENNVVTYLPRENFDNILIIYGSRPGGHKTIDDLWATLPVENHSKLELSGLGKEDIRALIYEVANKYEVERESAWIDAVQKRSQGNPLYLKLLCDAIENGSIEINDINALPEKIDEYYKAILQRYAQDMVDGDALLTGLFTFAAAKDYLTMAHLGLINKLGSAGVQRIGSTLKEVLYENPLTEEVLDYQLFHESFREYLVKEKAKEVSDAAGRIIDFCNTWQELEGSWEQRYPLENYASHLFESKQGAHHETLMDLIYDEAFANEQMKVLKSFDASNRLFLLALLKASDLNKEDQMLEAALCLVDLKYEEANDAPQVVAMVANGEMELALKRIERFGGADEEGVKRKFILYMLCLMELTLLNSKEKPFRKSAIEKLLNHLDEQIPADNSLIKWNDFFPSYLMFLMACEWANMGLDYLIVYKRTNYWKTDWIKEKCPYTDSQLEVLLACSRGISNESDKSIALVSISDELFQQGKIEEATLVIQEAVECASRISDETKKSFTLNTIAVELAKQGKLNEAGLVIHEAVECARGISTEELKSGNLAVISTELLRQGKIEEATSLIQESLACVLILGISNDDMKNIALGNIAVQMARQEKVTEALECVRYIRIPFLKIRYLAAISSVLSKKGKKEESASAIQEALEFASGISDEPDKSLAFSSISSNLAKQGKIEEALSCARAISNDSTKSRELKVISHALAMQGKIEEATSVIHEAVECARGISDELTKSSALNVIAVELANQGKFAEFSSVMRETLTCDRGIIYEKLKIRNLTTISVELVIQEKLAEALECARAISDDLDKSLALSSISSNLAKQGKIAESLLVMQEVVECAHYFCDEYEKPNALVAISNVLAKQGKLEEAASVMQEAIECAHNISISFLKRRTMENIFTELVQQGKLAEAIECARGSSKSYFSKALATISTELWLKGNLEESASALTEALECALGIRDDYYKIIALVFLSTQLEIQEKFEESVLAMQEAHTCTLGISDEYLKSEALVAISSVLAKQGKLDESVTAIQEALECTRGNIDESDKSIALRVISTELVIQGKLAEAEKIGLGITQIAERHSCWKQMVKSIKEQHGWKVTLDKVQKLQNEESRLFFLKGWAEDLSVNETDNNCLKEALPLLAKDTQSIEYVLQRYALQELMLGRPTKELMQRLNKSLNVQWAMDIKAKFHKESGNVNLTTNINEWLHDIEDEDDRDQIMLWAKQVAKGKITEEEFQVKINSL